ncbi:hypothetical protein XANCAGTX0491_007692 [Xanthoria calcicola]
MNDVDMPDAGPSAAAKSKAVSKTAKAGGAADEGKKRFEVKKVRSSPSTAIRTSGSLRSSVERSSTMGVGHCCGQLCYLSQPHHGSLHRMSGKPTVGHK